MDAEFANVIGQSLVQKGFGPGATDENLAHVRDVKQARGSADSLMLLHNARVLHRHFPAAEFDQARSQFLMGGEEWRVLEQGRIQGLRLQI
jgi:hypothetical protein